MITVADLQNILYRENKWHADYVRLRIKAIKTDLGK